MYCFVKLIFFQKIDKADKKKSWIKIYFDNPVLIILISIIPWYLDQFLYSHIETSIQIK